MSAQSNSSASLSDESVSAAGERWSVTSADRVLGLRAWGLILYGALPANLALLGVIEVKLTDLADLSLLVPVSFVPLFLTFLLIRGRQLEWYLTTDFTNLRSALHTLFILLTATAVFGLLGLLRDRYEYDGPPALAACESLKLERCAPLEGVVESFLFGVGSLVLTSTLFMTIMTKGGDLPGLPTSDFTKQLGAIREKLRRVQAAPVWKERGGDFRKAEAVEARTLLEALHSVTGNRLAKRSLRSVEEDLRHFIDAANFVEGSEGENKSEVRGENWIQYFERPESLNSDQLKDREAEWATYAGVRRLKGLRLGG